EGRVERPVLRAPAGLVAWERSAGHRLRQLEYKLARRASSGSARWRKGSLGCLADRHEPNAQRRPREGGPRRGTGSVRRGILAAAEQQRDPERAVNSVLESSAVRALRVEWDRLVEPHVG